MNAVTPECAPACASLLQPLKGYPPQHAEGCTHYRNPHPRGREPGTRLDCGCGDPLCGECMARMHGGWRKWDQ